MLDAGHFHELPLFRPLHQCLTLPEPGKDFRDCHHVLELFRGCPIVGYEIIKQPKHNDQAF